MNVTIQQNKDVLVVALDGELDHHSAPKVRDCIEEELDKGSANKIILNCKNLQFMDSSGLGVILGRYKRVKSEKGNMVAANLNQQVARVFALSGLTSIIKVYDCVEEALERI